LQLWSEGADVEAAFPEIVEIAGQCRFRDCSHNTEDSCAVRDALASGGLDEERWNNYCKLQKEQRHAQLQTDVQLRAREKQRWKKLSKQAQQKGRSKQ